MGEGVVCGLGVLAMYAYDCCEWGFKLVVVGGSSGLWMGIERRLAGWWLWYACLGVLLGLVVGGSNLYI